MLKQHVHDDKTDEWATPKSFVRPLADAVGGFDLDPASGAEAEPHAAKVYTEEDDGLSQPWHGAVFLNPPFSEKADWIQKAIAEVNEGRADLVVTVLPCDTSTTWFHDMVSEAPIHCFIGPGRQEFDRRGDEPGGTAPSFAVLVAVFGEEMPKELLGVLSTRGIVYYNRSLYRETNQMTFRNGSQAGGDDR
jgi:phage N-6-adenine-methyltransferase